MKRNLFNELNEGFAALKSEREGKITLKHHMVEKKPEHTTKPDGVCYPVRKNFSHGSKIAGESKRLGRGYKPRPAWRKISVFNRF